MEELGFRAALVAVSWVIGGGAASYVAWQAHHAHHAWPGRVLWYGPALAGLVAGLALALLTLLAVRDPVAFWWAIGPTLAALGLAGAAVVRWATTWPQRLHRRRTDRTSADTGRRAKALVLARFADAFAGPSTALAVGLRDMQQGRAGRLSPALHGAVDEMIHAHAGLTALLDDAQAAAAIYHGQTVPHPAVVDVQVALRDAMLTEQIHPGDVLVDAETATAWIDPGHLAFALGQLLRHGARDGALRVRIRRGPGVQMVWQTYCPTGSPWAGLDPWSEHDGVPLDLGLFAAVGLLSAGGCKVRLRQHGSLHALHLWMPTNPVPLPEVVPSQRS